MLARVLGVDRLQVYLAHDRPLGEAEKQRLRAMVARRGKGEPLAYILGDQEFCGLTLAVTPAVLIPRPETERLVDMVAAAAPEGGRGADLGTGSGAIAIALATRRPDLRLWASDISAAALEVARQNVAAHGVADRVELREGDWWGALGGVADLDFAVSNPPYVDPAQPELLAADVAAYEPAPALYTPAGAPGAPYEQLVAGLAAHVRPGGVVFFETGVGASDAALAALRAAACLVDVALHDDDAGLPRYLTARVRPGPA